MPTVRPRHQITETDDVAAAIDLAAVRWPEETRAQLVRRLIVEGAQRLVESPVERALGIEVALEELASLADSYPPGYLENLRRDWDSIR